MAGWTGLEPATSGLTGQRSNQLNYHPTSIKLQISNYKLKNLKKAPSRPVGIRRGGNYHPIEKRINGSGFNSSLLTFNCFCMVGGTGLEPVTSAL